jgi:multicomponent Na+:H+ antiporter subunit A
VRALLVLHLVVGLGIVAFGTRLGRRALLLGAVPSAVTIGWLATQLGTLLDGGVITESLTWVPALGLSIDLRLDAFAALMVVLIAGIGLAVFVYGRSYFSVTTAAVGRLAGLLTLFAGSMLGVALADHLIVLYTCWELTSITSYLLIGNDHTSAKARAAALHALLITGGGGLAMLGGFMVLAQETGTYRLSEILAAAPSGRAVGIALVLVLLGVLTKSAQYPFHGWLAGAMAAPTPVSAYLHSATMVKAGVYLLARLAPVFAVVGFWRPALVTIGLGTMLGGGLRALRQTDLKLLLAFGTVSQLGLMTLLFGLGTPDAVTAGCVLLLAHGLFKAALFMVVGILDHQTGTRDIRELPALDRGWRPVIAVAVLSAASMAGLPALFGFIAKEAAYGAVIDAGLGGTWFVVGCLVAASAITTAYSIRFVWGAFYGPRLDSQRVSVSPHPRPPSLAFLGPALAVAVPTALLGLVPGVLDQTVTAAGRSLDSAAASVHLLVWHGINAALVLSASAILAGVALFVLRKPVDRLLRIGDRLPDGGDAYLGGLRLLNATADRITGLVQNGSLPIYTGVILLTAAFLPLAALLTDSPWPGWPEPAVDPANLLIAGVIIGSALAAAVIRRRLSAVIFLGVTGYGMAALFGIRGAPDLALTQVAIETLSTVMFVLVLRRLPDRFERRSAVSLRAPRVIIATAVASVVFVFAVVAAGNRVAEPVADEIVARAYPEGHGRNIVNVILVDFRALDTAGEITVLAAAAIGAVALARAGRRPPGQPSRPPTTTNLSDIEERP